MKTAPSKILSPNSERDRALSAPISGIGILLVHAAPLFKLAFDRVGSVVPEVSVELECRVALCKVRQTLLRHLLEFEIGIERLAGCPRTDSTYAGSTLPSGDKIDVSMLTAKSIYIAFTMRGG